MSGFIFYLFFFIFFNLFLFLFIFGHEFKASLVRVFNFCPQEQKWSQGQVASMQALESLILCKLNGCI